MLLFCTQCGHSWEAPLITTLSKCPKCPPTPAAGSKLDAGKPRPDLIPPHAENELAEVLAYGATKYTPENWRQVPDARARYVAAALRHVNAHRRGEERDPESGLRHLAHAVASLMFVIELDHEDPVSTAAEADHA